MKKVLYFTGGTVILILCLRACISCWDRPAKDLGNNFALLYNGRSTCIIYNENGKSVLRGNGFEVVPGEVIDCAFDPTYIVARVRNRGFKMTSFWIVDKRKGYYKPIALDTLEYIDSLKKLNIKLELFEKW